LRTPLGAIIGVLSAFEDTPLTKDQKEMVHIMTRASDVVLSVVNNILDAAKLEAQKITLLNRTFDLLQVVEETLYILGEKAGNKQIELVLRYDHKTLPKYVKSDPDRLQQVLINLLSNSVKFTETGEVVLRISMASSNKSAIEENIVEKDTLFVEIIDTGIGIDSKFIKHIWESFAQADSSMTRRHDGTGLGLSICRHLVTINGGELGVTSELRKGSRFWFTWNVELLQTQPNANIQPSLSLSSTLRSERILVIDPVNTTRNTLVEFIEDHVKRVDAFDTAEKGVASAEMWKEQRNEVYDLVFFNIVEGNVEDVIKATKELKRISGEYRLCIVLMVFWSVRGRTLGREIMNEVGGQITTIYKPIMQNRVLECLYNNKSMTNEVYDFNVVKSLTDLKVEKYYHHNRPSAHINRSKDLSLKSNENTDKLKGIGEINNGESNQERTETLKRPTLKRMSSGADEISSEDDHTSKSRTRPTSKSKCVLCVEDNPINLKVIQHQLTKLGYRSLSATNGQEAVNLINNFVNHSNEGDPSSSSPNLPSDCREKISLVLMDCAMPVMSGYEASKAIREMESPISQVPIIALTASAIEGSKEKCLESGMNDFMTKPLKMSQLKEMLNKWLCD
ncbi:4607_t:CDS:2, partial [Acaulospora morrowiae]